LGETDTEGYANVTHPWRDTPLGETLTRTYLQLTYHYNDCENAFNYF